ncbi:MAG: hypothetical protein LBU85_10910 [Treponema sp.]|jgi:hypothetical protein|nr:hypothetical protein [Treponema sp.]
MKVVAVKDIIRKDVPIYYRLLYTGVAVIELAKGAADYRIDFTIEIKPTGLKEISVTFLDALEYPLLPVIKELKVIIDNMHTNELLPD